MAEGVIGRIERGFLALVLGLALSAWAAVSLADAGLLRPAFFAAAAALAAIFALLAAHRISAAGRPIETSKDAVSRPTRGPGSGAVQALAVAGVLVSCALIFFPPYETFVWASDSSVYLGLGAEIARNDGFELHDPLLGEIELPARAEIFRNWTTVDATGAHVRLPGGFAIPEITEPTVVAGFSPVFPALLAVAYDFMGARAMPWVAPIFGTLAMVALLLLGCRLGGTVAGVGAAALTTVAMPQVWFARFPMPEIVAELFVLAALLALWRALADDQPLSGALAGMLLGIAALGKLELAPIVAVALATFLGVRLLTTGRWFSRTYLWMSGAFATLMGYMVFHYLLLPTHYTLFVRQRIASNRVGAAIQSFGWGRFVVVVAAVGIIAIIALWRLGGEHRARLDRPRWWGAAVLVAVGAYFLSGTNAPGGANTVGVIAGLDAAVRWLGWYLPWPFGATLIAASIAAAGLSWRRQPKRVMPPEGETLAFVIVLILVAGLHVFRVPDSNEHIWRMRWFVPVVIPGLTLLTATLTATVSQRLWPGRGALAAAVVLAALTVAVALPSRPLLGQSLWEGSFRAGDEIAARLPEGSVVLMGADLAGTHLATALNYIHGVRTIVLRPGAITMLGDLITAWIENDRPVFLITGEQMFSFYAPALSLAEIDRRVLALPILERTTDRRPLRIVSEEARLAIGRIVVRREAPTLIDIGDPADDTFFQLFGFHGEELDEGPAAARFRWTSASARLVIPPTDRVRLTLSGARPDGVAPARLSLSVDGVLALEDLEISNEPMEVVIDVPAAQGATSPPGPGASAAETATTRGRNLVLLSTTFRPSQTRNSADERSLGVRLYRVELIGIQDRSNDRDRR